MMEALPSLTLGPPMGFYSNSVLQMACGPSNVSSCLGGRNGALHNILCFSCETLFSQHVMTHYQKQC
jgi:hypothetical protein